jgi:MFS family permease
MSLVLFAFGVRFVIYSVLKNPWWCLPVELFQGFTFGIFYATMASYASIVAPPGTEATVQGAVGAVFEGIGNYSCSTLKSHTVKNLFKFPFRISGFEH